MLTLYIQGDNYHKTQAELETSLEKGVKRIMQHGRNKGDKMTYCQSKGRHGSRERWRHRTFSVARNRYEHFVPWVTSRRLV